MNYRVVYHYHPFLLEKNMGNMLDVYDEKLLKEGDIIGDVALNNEEVKYKPYVFVGRNNVNDFIKKVIHDMVDEMYQMGYTLRTLGYGRCNRTAMHRVMDLNERNNMPVSNQLEIYTPVGYEENSFKTFTNMRNMDIEMDDAIYNMKHGMFDYLNVFHITNKGKNGGNYTPLNWAEYPTIFKGLFNWNYTTPSDKAKITSISMMLSGYGDNFKIPDEDLKVILYGCDGVMRGNNTRKDMNVMTKSNNLTEFLGQYYDVDLNVLALDGCIIKNEAYYSESL